jgi:UrcA family protein
MTSASLPNVLGICLSVMASMLVPQQVAYAGSPEPLPARAVQFTDLNLGASDGIKILYGRIQRAATDVCGPRERPGSKIPSVAAQACFTNAVSTAVERIDQPLLSAYHAEQLGKAASRGWQYTIASVKGAGR